MTFLLDEPILLSRNEENQLVIEKFDLPTHEMVSTPIMIKKLLKNLGRYIASTTFFSVVLFWIIYFVNLFCLSPSCCDFQKNRLVFNIV